MTGRLNNPEHHKVSGPSTYATKFVASLWEFCLGLNCRRVYLHFSQPNRIYLAHLQDAKKWQRQYYVAAGLRSVH